jgi:DNA-binding MarR family transcriptional regulator
VTERVSEAGRTRGRDRGGGTAARVTEAGPASGRTPAGDALTELVLATFALNGRFLAAAEELARPAGLTAARWQVLGAVLRGPRTVSEIARVMGLARQSVQRLADLLVEQGLAAYRDNPAHRRAKLLEATDAGLAAVRAIHAPQVAWADRIAASVGAEDLEHALATVERLLAALDADAAGARRAGQA